MVNRIFEFDIMLKSRKALEAQTLDDFIGEMIASYQESIEEWTMFFNCSSKLKGSLTCLLLENNDGILVGMSLKYAFPTSNVKLAWQGSIWPRT